MTAESLRYQTIAEQLAEAIRRGVYRAGNRLPSLRAAARAHRVALGTASRAYAELERRGLIEARPRSGYVVARPVARAHAEPQLSTPRRRRTSVDVSELVFELLDEIKVAGMVPLGSAFPSPTLFPLPALNRAAAAAARRLDPWCSVTDLPPGNEALRRAIAQRYVLSGCDVDPAGIVITNGALEAINLCLQAVTRPGDAVAIESPAFYATLQAIERLGLKAVEVPTDPRTGMDIDELARSIRQQRVRACVLMSSFQNPLGCSMPEEHKAALRAVIEQHGIPLIEDDVYAELYHDGMRPRPVKAGDRSGLVMHCSSFSKSLAPGYRIGWTAPGRYAEHVTRLKIMTSIATASLPQATLAAYLRHQAFDRHLRHLRASLTVQHRALTESMDRHFPENCRVTRPAGGYFLWVEFPDRVDTVELHRAIEREQISLAPGPLFSASRAYRNCVRLNFGHPFSRAHERAIARIGALAGRRRPSMP